MKRKQAKKAKKSKDSVRKSASVSAAVQELEEARRLVEQLRADQQEARKKLLFAKQDSERAQHRAKEARSDIDRAKVVVGEGSKVIVGQEFDADRDDVSEAGEREVGVRSTTAPKYSDKEYWERRFQEETEQNTAFEWYQDYEGDLQTTLRSRIPVCCRSGTGAILVVGCGNSLLSEQMFDDGIDFSGNVIAAMEQRAGNLHREGLTYTEMDARELEYEDCSFHSVIDKGTIDAVLADHSGNGLANAEKICQEVIRVLAVSGVYIVISSIQEEFYRPLFSQFCAQVELHMLDTGYHAGDEYSEKTYIYILTKSIEDADSDRNKLQSALFKARQIRKCALEESETARSHLQALQQDYTQAKSDKLKHGAVADAALQAWKPELEKEMNAMNKQEERDESKRAYQKHEHIALQRYAETKGLEHDEQEGTGYTWSQTDEDLLMCVHVPDGTTATDICCEIQARAISVGLKDSEPFVEGRFPHKVAVDQSLWSILDGSSVQIHIQKSKPVFWSCALDGDKGLDMEKTRDYRQVAKELQEMGNTPRDMSTAMPNESRTGVVCILNLSKCENTTDGGQRRAVGPKLKIEICLSSACDINPGAKDRDSVAVFADGDEVDLVKGYCDSAWIEEQFYGETVVKSELSLSVDDKSKAQKFLVLYLNADCQEIGRSETFYPIGGGPVDASDEPCLPSLSEPVQSIHGKVQFFRSDNFKGARPGYMFRMGPKGLGYYFDSVQQLYPKYNINVDKHQASTVVYCPNYLLEKQTNIGCYQLIVMFPEQLAPEWKPQPLVRLTHQHLKLEYAALLLTEDKNRKYELKVDFVSAVEPNKSTMDVLADHIAFRFPMIEEEKALLTLESRNSSCLQPEEFRASSFQHLACRFCLARIVNKGSITRAFPLPSPHWGELADYWVCEECDVSNDWSLTLSPKPKLGRCLVGEEHIMLHRDDITDNVRSKHKKSSSDADSNMLACRRCELVLGCSEGDGVVKLWKHRLAAPLNDSLFARHKGGIFSRYTAVAPIAAQILYFAQAQGCFNFELCVEADVQTNQKADANVHSGSGDWLLHASKVLAIRAVVPRLTLRLLNWDSFVKTNKDPEERAVLTVIYTFTNSSLRKTRSLKYSCEQLVCDTDDYSEIVDQLLRSTHLFPESRRSPFEESFVGLLQW